MRESASIISNKLNGLAPFSCKEFNVSGIAELLTYINEYKIITIHYAQLQRKPESENKFQFKFLQATLRRVKNICTSLRDNYKS